LFLVYKKSIIKKLKFKNKNMDKSKGSSLVFIFILILIIVVSLAGGAILGVYYQGQQKPTTSTIVQENSEAFAAMPALIGNLNSSIFLPITAHGNVKKIDANKITLNNGQEDFTINVNADADVNKFIADPAQKKATGDSTNYIPQTIKFLDIKVGDTVDIYVKVLQSGQLQGFSVMIYPISK